MQLRLSVTVVLLVSGGCGDSALDRLCGSSGAWTSYMLAMARCNPSPSPTFATADYMEQNCRGTLGPLLDSGAVSIAADEVLDRCTQALAASACVPELYKDWYASTAICADLLVGHTVTGVSCSIDDECGGASYCMRTGACGLCLGQSSSGAACSGPNACQSNLCEQGKCQPVHVPSGGQCLVDAQCDTGLICRDAGHCETIAGNLGSTCATDADCDTFHSSCVNTKCTALSPATQGCSAWGGGDTTRPHCRWYDGIGCFNGTCSNLPVAAAGAACGFDLAACGPHAWCTGGACAAIADEGGFCNGDPECGPYALCVEHACTFSDFNAGCEAPTK